MELFVPTETPWPRRPGICPTRTESPGELVVRGDVTLTDPWRTALDRSRSRSRYAALASLDAFAHAGMSIDSLTEYCKRLPLGSRGSRQAAELIRSAGWEIVVIRAEDLRAHPRAVLESVLDILLTRGWRPRPERIDEIKRRINRIAARTRYG